MAIVEKKKYIRTKKPPFVVHNDDDNMNITK